MSRAVGVRRSEGFHSFQLSLMLHFFRQNNFICLLFVLISTFFPLSIYWMQSEDASSESYEYDWTYTFSSSDEMDEDVFSDE